MAISDAEKEGGYEHPTSRAQLGRRLSALLDLFDSRQKASLISGRSTDQLAKYMAGNAEPPLLPLARLCQEKGVSLDWLATGEGGMYATQVPEPSRHQVREPSAQYVVSQSVSQETLTLALQLVEEVLSAKALPMPASDKAELTLAVAELLQEGVPEATVLRFVRAGR